MSNQTYDYSFTAVEKALDKLALTVHRADGETRQSFVNLVEAVKRWKELNDVNHQTNHA